ncbi:hypothetical protein RN001_000546 [Aquatica leii]|uniref:Spatacsin C-terminal domain-containing protein n=1 Tax=Aquatica leii TaxID=1421715 RepID=A0AAN7PA51_9COLE|nr:hypothetical protein RN001_000546 [Aquatica leii]
MAKRENNLFQIKPPPPSNLNKELLGVWNAWTRMGDREVVREAVVKGQHIDFAHTFLAARKDFDYESVRIWFKNEVLAWIFELLQRQQIFKASHILSNISLDPIEEFTIIFLETYNSDLRDYLANHLLKSERLSSAHKETWHLLRTIIENHEYLLDFDCDCLNDLNMKYFEDKSFQWKCEIGTQLFFKCYDDNIKQFVTAECAWKFLLKNNNVDLLKLWIRTYFSKCSDLNTLNEEVCDGIGVLFANLSINEDMVDSIPNLNVSFDLQEVIYNELSQFGIFRKEEKNDIISILKRISHIESMDRFYEILNCDNSSLTLSHFYKLLLDYCVKHNLYSVLNWCNVDLKCCDNIQSYKSKYLDLMKYLRHDSNFEDLGVGQNILKIVDFLSSDLVAYFQENPLTLLAVIFFLYPNVNLFGDENFTIKLNDVVLTSEVIISTLQGLPFLSSIIRPPNQNVFTLYDLLKAHSSLNPNYFKFHSEHTEVPNFNSTDLVQKYAYKKNVDYTFYLKQARPSFACKMFLSNHNQTSKSLGKLGINRKVLKLFFNNLNDDELAVSCITFLEMIGENSISLRIYVKVSKMLQGAYTYEEIQTLLRSIFKNPERVLEVLENVLQRTCVLTRDSSANDLVDEIKKQEIAVKLAQLHNFKLPEAFLKYCAQLNLWLPFMIFVQTYHYPLLQVQRLIQNFQNPVLAEHLYHGFTHEIQIDTQKELLMRDSRNFYLSRIGVRKNIDASSDSMYSSASSYGSTGSSSAGSDFLDGETLENEGDILHILIRCHNSIDPPKALLQTCYTYKCPIFAVLATSYEPDSIITHWLIWLSVSCGIDKDISSFETITVNANLVSDLLIQSIKLGFSRTLHDSFNIFLPENPLKMIIEFLDNCINLNFDVSVQTTVLDLFSKEIKKTKTSSPVIQIDYEMMYLTNKVWIEATAISLLATTLQHNFTSRYYQLCCLKFLHEVEIANYFSVASFSFLKYFNMLNYLFENQCEINVDLSVLFNCEKADNEIMSWINELLSMQSYGCALQVSKLQGICTDFIILKEWYSKFETRANNKGFWEECNQNLIDNNIDCIASIEFFEKCCEETSDNVEKYDILRIAHDWASRGKSKNVYDLEKKMWITYFSLDTKPDCDFNRSYNECLLYGEMKQVLESLDNDVDGLSLNSEGLIHLNNIIENLLNQNEFWQALRLSKLFGHKHMDVNLIELCFNLAEGFLMPYQLNVDQRLLLIKSGNLRSVGNRRRRTLMSSKGFSSMSSISNSPGNLTSTPVTDHVDIPMLDTLVILETLQERAKNGAKIIQNILMTYRIALNIEKPYQEVFKCADPTTMMIAALKEDCCNKLEVVHDVISLFNWSKEKVADFLCEQLIEAINIHIKLKTDVMILWNLNLDTDFNLILQLLVENCSTLGSKLYSYASALQNSQEDLPLHEILLIIELLIRSHDCFTADCNMEGISIILRKCQKIISFLLSIQSWKLIVRLLTGVARYTEMNYVFHLLRENDQFEFLLCKGCRKDNALKVALLKYLQRYCPEDRELYRIVALHFTLFSEIAQLWEEEARSIVRNLIAISKLEMQNNGLNIDTEPFVLLTNTDGTKICINKAMINYTHAAEYHLQGEKLTKAMHASKQAEVLALQMSLLKGLPSNSTVTCILNLSNDQILSLICTSFSFAQTLLLIDSINYKPDWATVLFNQCIIRNQPTYLEEFLVSFPLADSLLNDMSKKFLSLSSVSSQELRNMKEIIRKSTSVHVKYRIASELGFTDVIEELLESNQLAYLKDTVWKKGYKS